MCKLNICCYLNIVQISRNLKPAALAQSAGFYNKSNALGLSINIFAKFMNRAELTKMSSISALI